MSVGLRRKVTDDHQEFIGIFSTADKRNNTMAIVATVDPLKPRFSKILGVEGRFGFIKGVEGGRESLEPLMGWVSEELPFEIAPDVPLTPLPKFHAHEQGFLAGMGKHVGIEAANVGEFLPLVTGHFTDDVALAMHHFIVGERQHEVFAVVIPHAEGEVVLVKLAEPRIHAEVVEHVVHPAHVPFEVEP